MIQLQAQIKRNDGGFEVKLDTLKGEEWNEHELKLAEYLRKILVDESEKSCSRGV